MDTKFLRRNKHARIARKLLKKKGSKWEVALSDNKACYQAKVIKTVCSWCGNRNPWKRIGFRIKSQKT